MIVVTGAAGFIGSNLVKGLNDRGIRDIIAVDNLTKADKFRNLTDCDIADYWDKEDFIEALVDGAFDGDVELVFHNGACSDTMGADGRYMMDNNYRYTLTLLEWCQAEQARLVFASSAAVYGAGPEFREDRACEKPLNVYGPRESHKARMASVAYHCFNQFRADGKVKLFEGSGGYGPGEQRRDFVSVEDVVAVNLWLMDHPDVSGIFNLGTGRSQTFNDVACATVNALRRAGGDPSLSRDELVAQGLLEYMPFFEGLKAKYQSFTQADMTKLREAGYTAPFLTVEEGVARYVTWLQADAA